MATVGNLFVNVRGRTSGLVRDLKKAHGRATKDFYRNEALARERYTSAIGKVQAAKGMSPAIRGKRLAEADAARRNLMIARTRPARLARRRELLAQRERAETPSRLFQASPLAAFTTLLGAVGLTITGAKLLIGQAKRGAELTERFKYAGPMGGQIAQVEAQKVLQQLRFSKDPSISSAKLVRAQAGLELERTQMETSAITDRLIAGFDLVLIGLQNSIRPLGYFETLKSAFRITGLTGQAP